MRLTLKAFNDELAKRELSRRSLLYTTDNRNSMSVSWIEVLHDPTVVFVVLFLLSLVAAYILFKLLDSRANIRRKGWSAGGAIAGFLLILFESWYAVEPTLRVERPIMPLSIPPHFQRMSDRRLGIAIAIPDDWEQRDPPVRQLIFLPKHITPNSEGAKFLLIATKACDDLPSIASESDLPQIKDALREMIGIFHLRGPEINEPYLGHKGSTTPVSLDFPGRYLEPPRDQDFVLELIAREVFDERNSRCITIFYPDTDFGRRLSSTINITDPSPLSDR